MRTLFYMFCFISLIGCAQNARKSMRYNKTYSEETEKSFEEIEKARAAERYRKMRLENWDEYIKKNKRIKKARYKRVRVKPSPAPRPKPKRSPKPPKKNLIPANPTELKKEIDQNLTFYCMAHRKDPKFSSGEGCQEFTIKMENLCTKQYNYNDRNLLHCIKKRLKRNN